LRAEENNGAIRLADPSRWTDAGLQAVKKDEAGQKSESGRSLP
jgi:hypothetical protein